MCAPTTSNTTTLAKVDPGSNPKPLQRTLDQSRISNEPSRQPLDIMTPVRVVTSPPNPSDVTSAARIRSRFLHRLGIERYGSSQNLSPGKQTPGKVALVNPQYKPQVPCNPRGRNLPANHSTTDSASADINLQNTICTTSTCNASASNQERRKRSVTFHTECTVFPIPTRYEFSERVRKLLWSTPQELQMNAVRNAVEFAAEGWDWRTVVLDHEMMRNALTGELVHPIHFYMKRDFNLQQHFVQVMAARAHHHHHHHNTTTNHKNHHSHVRKSRSSPPRPQQPSCVAISM